MAGLCCGRSYFLTFYCNVSIRGYCECGGSNSLSFYEVVDIELFFPLFLQLMDMEPLDVLCMV